MYLYTHIYMGENYLVSNKPIVVHIISYKYLLWELPISWTFSITTLSSYHIYILYITYIYIYRDLKLHQNKWHCDCHLLNLRNWLQNFTVPNSIEPRCHSPPRLISESIKKLVPSEFACIPKVSPTSMYLEVIEGKNMSLVCSIEVSTSIRK